MRKGQNLTWLLAIWSIVLPTMLMAQPCPPATPTIVINEIHYNPPSSPDPADWVELYNPGASAVDISGWQFQDESAAYTIPAATSIPAGGYLVIVQNTTAFYAVYGAGVSNYIGPMPFGLSGAGEEIKLLSDAGCTCLLYTSPSPRDS